MLHSSKLHTFVKRSIWTVAALLLLLAIVKLGVAVQDDRSNETKWIQITEAKAITENIIQITFSHKFEQFYPDDLRLSASTNNWWTLDNRRNKDIQFEVVDISTNASNQTVVWLEAGTLVQADASLKKEENLFMNPLLTAEKYYPYDMNTAMVLADRLLTWQTEAGGWDAGLDRKPDPKDESKVIVDRAWDGKERRSELTGLRNEEAGTLAQGATVNEMLLIAEVYRKTGDRRYKESLLKAVDFLLEMQYSNGGWPEAYPLNGSASDEISFEDGLAIRAMTVLSMVLHAEAPFPAGLLDEERKNRVEQALGAGLSFIIEAQLRDGERLTGWAEKYHPETLKPVKGEEGAGQVNLMESVLIVQYLMTLKQPSDEVKHSIQTAVNFFKEQTAQLSELDSSVLNVMERIIQVYETTGYFDHQLFVEVTDTKSHHADGRTLELESMVKVAAGNAAAVEGNFKAAEQPDNPYMLEKDTLIPLQQIEAEKVLVVAKDGSGDYTDVQAAVDAVPENNKEPITIYIKQGFYFERIIIPETKPFITFVGESKHHTLLTFLDITGTGFNGNSTIIEADDFTANNLTFANEAGAIGTAAAVEVRGDRGIFRGVRFMGYQDTVYLNSKGGRFYFEDCYIEGAVDFIYGPGTAWFEKCVIFNKRSGGYITAASTPEEQRYGIIFNECIITGYPWVKNVYFGRPWREYANVVFLHSWIDDEMIHLQGWHNWGSLEKEKTSRYMEYGSYGPGADIRFRAKWTKQLSSDEAAVYTPENALSGQDGWAPHL